MNKIDEFIEYLRFEKKYSENTIDSYNRDLKKFYNYINKDFSKVTKNDVSKFIQNISKQESPKSVSRIISTLKSFYKFLQINKYTKIILLFPKDDYLSKL